MGKIARTMPDWLKYDRGSTGQDALKYIETGDPAALGRVKPSGQMWSVWTYHLPTVMAEPAAMGEEDRRALHVLATADAFDQIGSWLSKALGRAKGDERLHDLVREELATVNVPAVRVSAMTVAFVPNLTRGAVPNSAGRHLLALSDADLAAAVKRGGNLGHGMMRMTSYPHLAEFLLDFAPERLGPLIPAMEMTPGLAAAILQKGADRYEMVVVAAWRKMKGPSERIAVGEVLAKHDLERYGREMLEIARAILVEEKAMNLHDNAGIWMIQNFGPEMLDDVVAYFNKKAASELWADQANLIGITSAAVKALGPRAIPVVLAALRSGETGTHLAALSHLIQLDDGPHEALIRSELERRLTGMEGLKSLAYRGHSAQDLIDTINLAARWKPRALSDRFWELLANKSKVVRETAARALGRIGPEVVPRGRDARGPQGRSRAAAVVVLATAGTPEAQQALEGRLDDETDDDIRDAMLLVLDAALAALGARSRARRSTGASSGPLRSSRNPWPTGSTSPACRPCGTATAIRSVPRRPAISSIASRGPGRCDPTSRRGRSMRSSTARPAATSPSRSSGSSRRRRPTPRTAGPWPSPDSWATTASCRSSTR